GSGTVWADPDRLQQVVWNLLTNAIKFTPEGGVVSVRLARAGSQVEVVVRDSGEGISPEFVPHVFERFRQADSSTTRPHGGLGLGLAMVRHLVDAHGGTVVAESAGKEKGASFTVRLPRHVSAEEDAPPAPAPAPERAPRPLGPSPRTLTPTIAGRPSPRAIRSTSRSPCKRPSWWRSSRASSAGHDKIPRSGSAA